MGIIDETLEEALRYHRAGDLDTAERLYQKILEVRPRDAAAMHFRGLAALQRGDYESGIPSIAAAIEIDAEQPVYHNNLGEAYRTTGNLAAAQACFERALKRFPQSAEMHNNLGLTFHALGRFGAARCEFEEAVRLRPTMRRRITAWASCCRWKGDPPRPQIANAGRYKSSPALSPRSAHWVTRCKSRASCKKPRRSIGVTWNLRRKTWPAASIWRRCCTCSGASKSPRLNTTDWRPLPTRTSIG